MKYKFVKNTLSKKMESDGVDRVNNKVLISLTHLLSFETKS